jgi:ABC-type spermidine/putrescine transport system permease subunit II
MTLAVHQWAVWHVPFLLWLPMFSLYLFFSFPYAFRVIYSAYRAGIQASRETASSLGANSWQTLFRVELPLIAPHVTIAFSFAFAVAYGQYLIEVFFLSGRHTVFSIRMAAFLEGSNRTVAAVYTVFYIALGVCVVLLPSITKRINVDRELRS